MKLVPSPRAAAAAALIALCNLCGLSSVGAASEAAPPTDTVVIMYRCAPADRPLLRRKVLATIVPRFEKWKRSGILAGYRLLFSSLVSAESWDMLAIVRLGDFHGIERWRDIERTFPGGLSGTELRVMSPTSEFVMDTVQFAETSEGIQRPGVFLVIPYVFSPTPVGKYIKYARGYVIPEMEGWLKRDNISGYGLYVNQFYPDSPVQALLVIEYKDIDALAQREQVVEETREALSHDPAWKSWSELKGQGHMRVEKQSVIAEQLAADSSVTTSR